jgi:hypothetical protein
MRRGATLSARYVRCQLRELTGTSSSDYVLIDEVFSLFTLHHPSSTSSRSNFYQMRPRADDQMMGTTRRLFEILLRLLFERGLACLRTDIRSLALSVTK